MKKFLLTLLLCLISQSAFAKTIHVQALEDFSTQNPPQNYSVLVLDELQLNETITLKEKDTLYGKIIDVTDPKRLKRDAGFTFVPETVKRENGETIEIVDYHPAKYTTKLDKGQIAKSTALSVGNYFVKGLSLGYSAVEGAVKNEQDNRFKSSVTAIYENSPVSYVEKGNEIEISKNQVFLLNFKIKCEKDNLPNYEYEKLPENNDWRNLKIMLSS